MYSLPELFKKEKNKLFQLALQTDKVKPEKLQFPAVLQVKWDGVFCAALLDEEGECTIYSRSGEVYVSMKHIEEALKRYYRCTTDTPDQGTLIIFEAWAEGVNQSTISGWARDTKAQHQELVAKMHDLLDVDLKTGEINTRGRVYGNRMAILEDLFPMLPKETPLRLCQYDIVHSWEEATALADEWMAAGHEGAILRNPRSTEYAPGKRNHDLVKIKRGVSYDLEVIGVEEGSTGKYKGTLGTLVCRWKNGGVIYISGMKDSQRHLWWSNPDEIIGKIVQVDAMSESSKGKLREPRFKGIRTDKTEGDF